MSRILSRKIATEKVKQVADVQSYGEMFPTNLKTPNVYIAEMYAENDEFTKAPIKRVPINRIVTQQSNVGLKELCLKIEGKWGDHCPRFPYFIRLQDGRYWLDDGNHRVQARAWRGFTHIRGYVVDYKTMKQPPGKIE